MLSTPELNPAATPINRSILEGRYVLQELIGRGGMASVYLATDTVLDRAVAIKLLHPSISNEPQFVQQFLEMERHIARLFHPHLVTIFDAGLAEEGCYVVMEYAPGGSLGDLVTRGTLLPVWDSVRVVCQVAGALSLLHSERIIHGDIKPDNVLLDENGDAKLVDFGIARLATTSRVIKSESIGGSAPYLAPEQLEHGHADSRSDIYALGLVTYELLAGRKAFEGENWVAVAAARLARDPQPLSQVRPQLPQGLSDAVGGALARNPDRRYASAEAFSQALLPYRTAAAESPSTETRAAPAQPPDQVEPPPPAPPAHARAEVIRPAVEQEPPARAATATAEEPLASAARRPRPLVVSRPVAAPEREPSKEKPGSSTFLRIVRGEHPASAALAGAVLAIDAVLLLVILLLALGA